MLNLENTGVPNAVALTQLQVSINTEFTSQTAGPILTV